MLTVLTLLACQPDPKRGAPDVSSAVTSAAVDDTGTAPAAEDTGGGGDGRLASSPLGQLQVADPPASITVTLTDAPGDFEAVPVTIGGVYATRDKKEDLVLVDEPSEWDLLELQDGVTGVLGSAELEAASFDQIRLLVLEASVIVDGEEHELQIPSGQQTGIKIPYAFSVEAGVDYELRLDFDAHKSIRQLGNGRYQLSPVVSVAHFGEAAGDTGE